MSSSNNNPFRTNNYLKATANPCQTLYQSHTASNIGPANSPLSSSTVNSITPSPASTQIYFVPFFAMSKSVKFFFGVDDQYTLEEDLHQIEAHTFFLWENNLSIL